MPRTNTSSGSRMLATTVVALVVAVVPSACTSVGTTGKGGVPRSGEVRLGFTDRAANPDGHSDGGTAFIAALAEESGGLLVPTATSMHDLGPGGLLAAVRDGSVQGAWVPAADLERAGLGHFAALSAPLEVTSFEAQAALTEPAVAQHFLDTLEGSGLTGLTLLAGSLRRPAGAEAPLRGPETWQGVRVWARSPTQAATFTALGAVPAQAPGDARDTDLAMALQEDEAPAAPYVTSNVVLWPRLWVLVVGTDWLRSLSAQERGWVEAAAAAARAASVTDPPEESSVAARLCEAGARFSAASARDLADLHRAVLPVVRGLADDPEDGRLLALVRGTVAAIRSADTGGGPPAHQGSAIIAGLPGYCSHDVSPIQEVADYPTTPSGIPPGTYRAHLSAADIEAAGSLKTRDAQVVTLVIGRDGTYRNSSRFDNDGEEMTFEAGRVYGDGDTAYFVNSLDRLRQLQAAGEPACVWDQPQLGCITNTEPYSVTWRLLPDGAVRFSDPRGMNPDPVSILSLVANPFRPVA